MGGRVCAKEGGRVGGWEGGRTEIRRHQALVADKATQSARLGSALPRRTSELVDGGDGEDVAKGHDAVGTAAADPGGTQVHALLQHVVRLRTGVRAHFRAVPQTNRARAQ